MSLQAVKAAQITVGYCGVYTVALMSQVYHKKRLHSEAKKEGKTFDRYKSPGMFPYDRLTANFLEWMPVFLGPLWSMAATGTLSDQSVRMAWAYVGFRSLYVGLVWRFGVVTTGYNPSLWASTFPGYVCLLYLLGAAVRGVF